MMDIKHILEKLSEIDTKHTLLESAPVAKVLVESTVAETKRTSIYDVLVSELMAEAIILYLKVNFQMLKVMFR
jgi:hypothetical protein